MTTTARQASSATRIHADHTVLKHLGDWTADRAFHVRSRKSTVVLDLRAAGRDEIREAHLTRKLAGHGHADASQNA